MNYGLMVSLRMETWIKKLEEQKARDRSSGSSQSEEEEGEEIEEKALRLALEEIYEENGKSWQPWARNAKSIRLGEIILIVDSDTIVPEVRGHLRSVPINFLTLHLLSFSVFRIASEVRSILIRCTRFTDSSTDAAREMAESPEVAIIQHESGRQLSRNCRSISYLTCLRCYASCLPLF